MQSSNLQKYFIKNLNISLSEAKLLESEINRYFKIKEGEETPTEEQINQAEAYLGSSLVSLKTFFDNFFTTYDRDNVKGNETSINTMSDIILNNDTNSIRNYPRELINVYNWLSSGVIKNRDTSLDEAFIKIFVDAIKGKENNENYFWVKPQNDRGKHFSKINFLLKIEKLVEMGGGMGIAKKFKQVFNKDLFDILNPSFTEKKIKSQNNNFVKKNTLKKVYF
jgi:hypothetical protein